MEVAVLIGLPGAGKSSFYRAKLSQTHVLISKDQMCSRKKREARQQRFLREALRAGRSVAIDNLNASCEERRAILDIAKEFAASTIAYYFPITAQTSVRRNKGPGRTEVPLVAIYSTVKKMETPSPAEGFDHIRIVRFLSPTEFDICSFNEESAQSHK